METCTKLGILQDDDEWNQVLTEADFIRAPAVRELYITIVLYCEPADPRRLFQDHWEKWTGMTTKRESPSVYNS